MTKYGTTSTDWILIKLSFTEPNYDFKDVFDQKDTARADMCFSNILKTHSVYKIIPVKYLKDLLESILDYKNMFCFCF